MNFRAYDILTQLIPGLFFSGLIITLSKFEMNWTEYATGAFALLTIFSFIIGYIINAFGHFLESILVNSKIKRGVKDIYEQTVKNINKEKIEDKKKSERSANDLRINKFLIVFTKFTKLSHLETESKENKENNENSFKQDYVKLDVNSEDKLTWINEDKKLARSIVSVSVLLLLILPFININETMVAYSFRIYFGLSLLLLAGIYRYILGSIDYAYMVIQLSSKVNNTKNVKT